MAMPMIMIRKRHVNGNSDGNDHDYEHDHYYGSNTDLSTLGLPLKYQTNVSRAFLQ